MSKKMGLTFLASLSPITANAFSQVKKLGGKGAAAFVTDQFSGGGIKSWWSGQHIGIQNGRLGWGSIGDTAQQMATRSNRRFAVGALGTMAAMNTMVGDEGFLGFAKGSINTGMALSVGAMAKKPLWKATKKMGGLGKWGIRGGSMGIAGAWAANKLGVI